jgi:ABC-type antimicrobial peptide transport system permease subunit
MIRTSANDPAAVAGAVQKAIRAIDPTAAIGSVRTMPDVIAQSLGRPKFYFSMLGTFAAVAMFLAIAGLYGVLSYAVAQRTREIGIRAALGCSRSALLRLISGEALRLVGAGLLLGIAGGAAATRLMTFMLYGTSPLDITTWVVCSTSMVAAGMAAAIIPARRAARVDPLIAIQAE